MNEPTSNLDRSEWQSGWRVVVGGSVGMGTGIGLYAMVAGLFVRPLQSEFGWARAEIAAAGLLALLAALLFPLLGRAVDRFGSRRIAVLGMALLSVMYAILSRLNGSLSVFYAVMMCLALVGPLTSPIVITRAVNMWFERNRGLAIGITMAGVSITAAFAIPLLEGIISSQGWRVAFLALGVTSLLIGLPTVAGMLKDRPRSEPENHKSSIPESAAPVANLKSAVKDARFWLLAAAMLAVNLPIGGILSQLQPLLLDKGVPGPTAAALGSVFVIGVAAGRLGTGVLLDRYWAPAVAATVLAMPIIGVGIVLSDQLPSIVLLGIAAFTFGLSQGAEGDFVAFLVPRYFGLGSYGAIFGSLVMCVSISLSLGAVLFSLVHDRTGDYSVALMVAVPLYIVGAACVLGSGLVDRARGHD